MTYPRENKGPTRGHIYRSDMYDVCPNALHSISTVPLVEHAHSPSPFPRVDISHHSECKDNGKDVS